MASFCRVEGCSNRLGWNNKYGYCRLHNYQTHLEKRKEDYRNLRASMTDEERAEYNHLLNLKNKERRERLPERDAANRRRQRAKRRTLKYERRDVLYQSFPGCWYCGGMAPPRFLLIEDIDQSKKAYAHEQTDISNQVLSCIACNSAKKNYDECVYKTMDALESQGVIEPNTKQMVIKERFKYKVIPTQRPDHW